MAGNGFPDATNTGVPAGVTLTPSGGLIINTPGVVIEGLNITGMVTINADNVTLKNCTISVSSWAVINITSGSTGVVIQDCEINGLNAEGVRGISGQGTFLRNDIHNVEDGVYVLGPSLIQDNYIHDLQSNWSGPHYDGIAIDGGSNVTIRHNTIINENGQTSAVMIDNYFGPISNITVDNNLLVGGAYTIFVDGQFGGGSVTDVKITNNQLGKGQFGYIANTKTSPVLIGNVDSATGQLLSGQQGGGASDPTSDPTIAMFSTDSGTLGDGITNDNTLSLSGTAAANSTVKVFDGTMQIGQTTANGNGAWNYTTGELPDGSHSFTTTFSSGGTTSGSSSPLTVRVDTVAPSAPTIASFSSDTGAVGDGITSDNVLVLTGTAAASSAVKLYDGSMLLGTATANGSGAWSYTTDTLADATHNFMARATDAAGNTSMASSILTITVDSDGSGSTPSTGTSGNDVLKGTSGADIMTGRDGADTYTVNNSGDQVVELANQGVDKVESTISYTLASNVENLQLMGSSNINGTGNSLNNTIIGNDVSNTLKGGAGNDTLNGWGGKDTLIGDSGSDVFQFSSQFSADGDQVMDFVHGVDKLDFSKIDARTSWSGDQVFIFDGYTNGGNNGHLWAVEDQAAGVTHVYGKTGDFQFHIDLQGVNIDLTSSDFIL